MHRVILWSQGQAVRRCSRKTWRDGQSKLLNHVQEQRSRTTFTEFSAVQHGTLPWELQTPPTVGITEK